MWEMHCKCVSSRASLKIKQHQQKITTPNKTPPNHKQNKQKKKKIHTSILIICLFMEWHVLIYLYRLQTCHKERQLFSPWCRKQPQVLRLNEKHCCTHKDHSCPLLSVKCKEQHQYQSTLAHTWQTNMGQVRYQCKICGQ